MIKKLKKKHRALVIIVFISILLVVYFRPRTLWDTLGLEDMESNGIVLFLIFLKQILKIGLVQYLNY